MGMVFQKSGRFFGTVFWNIYRGIDGHATHISIGFSGMSLPKWWAQWRPLGVFFQNRRAIASIYICISFEAVLVERYF